MHPSQLIERAYASYRSRCQRIGAHPRALHLPSSTAVGDEVTLCDRSGTIFAKYAYNRTTRQFRFRDPAKA